MVHGYQMISGELGLDSFEYVSVDGNIYQGSKLKELLEQFNKKYIEHMKPNVDIIFTSSIFKKFVIENKTFDTRKIFENPYAKEQCFDCLDHNELQKLIAF